MTLVTKMRNQKEGGTAVAVSTTWQAILPVGWLFQRSNSNKETRVRLLYPSFVSLLRWGPRAVALLDSYTVGAFLAGVSEKRSKKKGGTDYPSPTAASTALL